MCLRHRPVGTVGRLCGTHRPIQRLGEVAHAGGSLQPNGDESKSSRGLAIPRQASGGVAALLRASEPAFAARTLVGAAYLVLRGVQALVLRERVDVQVVDL